ncbi:hypothetical protein R1flu_005184 [Riccia fluitans]|uniref:Uncharacterized protein n=1 Tax=Riccia fluitans TaxID=41844 RepID=A0ABD1YSR2_9MARC
MKLKMGIDRGIVDFIIGSRSAPWVRSKATKRSPGAKLCAECAIGALVSVDSLLSNLLWRSVEKQHHEG